MLLPVPATLINSCSNPNSYTAQIVRRIWKSSYGGGAQIVREVGWSRRSGLRWKCCREERREGEPMASTRKLPQLQGTLFRYGTKSIQVSVGTILGFLSLVIFVVVVVM